MGSEAEAGRIHQGVLLQCTGNPDLPWQDEEKPTAASMSGGTQTFPLLVLHQSLVKGESNDCSHSGPQGHPEPKGGCSKF